MDATERFTDRAEVYARCRPHYPDDIIDILQTECGLKPEHLIADIGSGTGLLSEVFLKNGNLVSGIEPNEAMRREGEAYLRNYPGFSSVSGRAEATGLTSKSIDFITAGAAFHWFDHDRALPEFQRILKPDGWLVRVGNRRRADMAGPMQEVDALMKQFTTHDHGSRRKQSEEALARFFGSAGAIRRTCDNVQTLDWSGFQGLLLSHSSIPLSCDPEYDEMIASLKIVFDRYQENQHITLNYATEVTFGHLARNHQTEEPAA